MLDPIVEQVRRAGQAYVDSFKGDLHAVCADLRRRTEQSRKNGHSVAAVSPIAPRKQTVSKKKAG